MKLKRILTALTAFMIVMLVKQDILRAKEDSFEMFQTDANVNYFVKPDGITEVTHEITITNLEADLIVSGYTIEIKEDVYDAEGSSKDRKIAVTATKENNVTKLTARFNDYIIGEGKKNVLVIKYKTKKTAVKVGNVWNINIPKMSDNIEHNNYNIRLSVPAELGPKLYVSPQPDAEDNKDNRTTYYFSKDKIVKNGVNASFGTYQSINFKLKYQLENDSYLRRVYEITLPPEIEGLQQVKYESINPHPKKIYLDKDGNSVATFVMKSKQQLDVEVIGNARITGKQMNPTQGGSFGAIPANLKAYTTSDAFWETNSLTVANLAKTLKNDDLTVSENARNIYDYLLENYNYDFSIANKESLTRKGAENAILNKDNWGCMEFTDTFIAVARSMGIPARQLNGYALTKDEDNKPLSVVLASSDKLHAWPEFYDPSFGWVQIDPTWGSTSGIDYFTKLDTNHFVFVIRGRDSEYPLSAGEYRFSNDSKLVEVDFPENVEETTFEPKLEISKVLSINPLTWIRKMQKLKVKNTGKVFVTLSNGTILPPFSTNTILVQKGSMELLIKGFNDKETKYAF